MPLFLYGSGVVRIGRTQRAHVRGHLAQQLPVRAGQDQRRQVLDGLVHAQIDPVGQIELYGMRIAQREAGDPALDFTAIPDSENLKLTREPGGDPLNRVGGQRPRQAVQRGPVVAFAHDFERAVLLTQRDARRYRNRLLALGSFHQKLIADSELDSLRQRYRLFSNS
jgi:hypothetical protein